MRPLSASEPWYELEHWLHGRMVDMVLSQPPIKIS